MSLVAASSPLHRTSAPEQIKLPGKPLIHYLKEIPVLNCAVNLHCWLLEGRLTIKVHDGQLNKTISSQRDSSNNHFHSGNIEGAIASIGIKREALSASEAQWREICLMG